MTMYRSYPKAESFVNRCPSCSSPFDIHRRAAANDPFINPVTGDIGVCMICNSWWEMIPDRMRVYYPSSEDVVYYNENFKVGKK